MIVESPAKARTISRFLGRGFIIEASIGHIRDLPQGAKEVPEEYKKEDWAYLGVNVAEGFKPVYVVPRGKLKQVRKLKGMLKGAKDLYLATDEDREGEAISWHLCEVLEAQGAGPPAGVSRNHQGGDPRRPGASPRDRPGPGPRPGGPADPRPALRLRGVAAVVAQGAAEALGRPGAERGGAADRRPRAAANGLRDGQLLGPAGGVRQTPGGVVPGRLGLRGRAQAPVEPRFRPGDRQTQGPLAPAPRPSGGGMRLAARLREAECRVSDLEDRPYTTRPYAPFTTSTLQQEANRKFGFSARQTMDVAQSLYENGFITYMRTDSTTLAQVAVDAARDLIAQQYGPQYLPDAAPLLPHQGQECPRGPRGHPAGRASVRAARDPPGKALRRRLPALRPDLEADGRQPDGRRPRAPRDDHGRRWATPASRSAARGWSLPDIFGPTSRGPTIPRPSWRTARRCCRRSRVGENLDCRGLEPKGHTTQPPNRYSEAALTRTLEELGIGRPSTYAAIIETILARKYVFKRGGALVPTWVAFAVSQLLENHLPALVDYHFTAAMEDELDAISRGEMGHVEYLKSFYFGNGRPPG